MNNSIEIIQSIALPNKYTKWYISIITSIKVRIGYCEKHHILPKSFKIGNTEDENNLILLTAREHYICHMLLRKMFTGRRAYQMNYAFIRMSSNNTRYTANSKIYSSTKESLSSYLTINNPNADGSLSKLAWSQASIERREAQSKLMARLNTKLKSKPKEFKEYECTNCRDYFYREEFSYKIRNPNPFCSNSCAAIYGNRLRKLGKSLDHYH